MEIRRYVRSVWNDNHQQATSTGVAAWQPVVDDIIGLICARKFYAASKRLHSSKELTPGTGRREFIEALNELVLPTFEREWTSHGISRSFRFWSEDEQVAYIESSLRLVRELTELTSAVCLGYGSVLSIFRDQRLNPHDDDLDIIMALPAEHFSSFRHANELVSQLLSEKGYSVSLPSRSHVQARRNGQPGIGIFVGVQEDGYVSWRPGPRKTIIFDRVFPAKLVSFMGLECPIPCDPEHYLESVYGRGWKTPRPRWGHDWGAADYVDLLAD